ncbi:cytochrome C biogenesis protein [Dokdonia sinensis]|uniref:Cytochrome C biogenesis protein n=1 Tax=Dokdonia sinensis TaxID=2479847 RepID=A0A3M0GCQ0_9FLAO|nr:cytochrome c biogenesis protein CcsA [Dokdonia sinensis]RMB60452.1 cytochrome C biogenesis protein [Dokdonia sinensis]
MQKKLFNFLFSTRLMGVLFIVYAAAMITGTFMDAGQDTSPTPYSRYWIYNAWWFELIHVLLVINFIGNIFRYKLLRKEKITTLIFHLSFILVLIGAGVTRYISYEGVMPITEGESESTFLSEKTYLQVFIDGERNGEPARRVVEKELMLSERLNNSFTWNTHYEPSDSTKTDIEIKFNKFIDGAEDGFVPDDNGKYHLKVVEAGDGTRHEHFLVENEVVSIHNVLYAFNKPTDGAININYDGENYTVRTPFEGTSTVMATQTESQVVKDSVQTLNLRALYNLQGVQFVVPEPAVKGTTGIVEKALDEKNDQNALFVDVTIDGQTETVGLLGGKGWSNDKKMIQIGDYKLYLSYGSKNYELPFSIYLKDFIAERYPGTEKSFASFKSEVIVEDPEQTYDYDIYMNHVLDHKGFRFFQASFPPDEKGTILSVSHDFWGTWITYIGYFLMYLGLMLILFDKGSRFGDLKNRLDKIKAKKAKLLAVVMLFAFAKAESSYAQEINTSAVVVEDSTAVDSDVTEEIIGVGGPEESHLAPPTQAELEELLVKNAVSKEHAEKFGRMIIQDNGRMMPINTFSSLLLRKLTRSDTYAGLNADQVMLSMLENPVIWYNVELLYLKKGNDSIRNIVGVPEDRKYLKLMDFFTPKIEYKLEPFMASAYSEATPTVIDKDFRDIDQRIALLNSTLGGSILKIFPKPDDVNDTWLNYSELNESGFKGMDSLYTKQIIPLYLQSLREGKQTGDYTKAETFLNSIKSFQKRFAGDIMPSEEKIEAEIHYNKNDPFKKLYWLYMLAAFFMMTFVIVQIFSPSKFVNVVVKLGAVITVILFLLHTASLIWRWYISGHAPWSDGYESVLYVAWATMFFGLGFGRKSMLTIASTAFVTGFILWAASMNWMNPEIANLQAVLNSYWLMIHTAVIVASYGPFTLGAVLGIVSLMLMIFTTEKNRVKMDLNIKEITIINELALTVGMVLLAIGTFLGGQWANESWGRYWGWDPKETWALISLIIYAFVIHMRLIPGLRGRWLFNLCSIIALGFIFFTYFGVNYYLSGLHAYQSGGDIAMPKIIITAVVLTILGISSWMKYKKYFAKA